MIHAALLTVLLETLLFYLYGYREKRFLVIVALSNLLTNVSLNLCILLTMIFIAKTGSSQIPAYTVIACGEICVVAAEFFLYANYLEERSGKLFLQTFCANAVSFLTGLVLTHFLPSGTSILW